MALGTAARPKLLDMKMPPPDKKKLEAVCEAPSYDGDKYPWGLRLRLGTDELKKLGIELPKVGDEFHIVAVASVTEVSSREGRNESHKNLELQIKKLGVGKKA